MRNARLLMGHGDRPAYSTLCLGLVLGSCGSVCGRIPNRRNGIIYSAIITPYANCNYSTLNKAFDFARYIFNGLDECENVLTAIRTKIRMYNLGKNKHSGSETRNIGWKINGIQRNEAGTGIAHSVNSGTMALRLKLGGTRDVALLSR